MSDPGSLGRYTYGLGRALSETTQTLLILGSTTTQVWDGLAVVQQDSPLTGTRNLIRDVTGDVAIQTGGLLAGGTKWGLTDRLGSTIAQTSGSKVGQLARYSDWGVPTFATLGWTSATGYTGELSDTTAGLNHYFARSYQPMTGTWLSADPYRGSLSSPGTLGRYSYVEGNPSTHTDWLGYRVHALFDGGGGGATPPRTKGGPIGDKSPEPPRPQTPSDQDGFNSARHGPNCILAAVGLNCTSLAAIPLIGGAAAIALIIAYLQAFIAAAIITLAIIAIIEAIRILLKKIWESIEDSERTTAPPVPQTGEAGQGGNQPPKPPGPVIPGYGGEDEDDGEGFDRVGGEASKFSAEELAELASRHGGPGRPSAQEALQALQRGIRYTKDGSGGVRFDYNGVRVIINESTPWRSTTFYY